MTRQFKFAWAVALTFILLCGCGLSAATAQSSQGGKKAKPKPATKPCVAQIHVIQGCSACETMLKWLRDGGVKLDIQNVESGRYELYPMVLYSDKGADHGERMYEQKVTIPAKLCVVSASIGIE